MLFDFSYDAGEICCDGRMQNDRKRQKRARLRTSKIALQNSRRATSKRADETQNVFRSRNKIRCKNRENDVRNSLKLSHFAENGYHGWCGDNVRVLSSDSKLFLYSTASHSVCFPLTTKCVSNSADGPLALATVRPSPGPYTANTDFSLCTDMQSYPSMRAYTAGADSSVSVLTYS